MSALRQPRTVAYTAERTEAGGWRITLPLTVEYGKRVIRTTATVPSKNRSTRKQEHWAVYQARKGAITSLLLSLMAQHRPDRPHPRARTRRVGLVSGVIHEACVFAHARMTLTLYHRTAAILNSDPPNWTSGAEALLDALVSSGWLYDDDRSHLLFGEPVLCVDRERPRVEVELTPWNGVR